MENKICVYAIAKNEIERIDAWLNSMSEADYIVVLDTGSTDGTYEYLKEDKRVTKVKQKIIDPWRFDVARNESIKLIPKDANILVCTDPDELFTEHWAQWLRDNWREDIDRCFYRYAWSHNDVGEPTDVFLYDKIHRPGKYYWKFPVHEVLFPFEYCQDFTENKLMAEDAFMLHHYQNNEKERKYYFDLLQLACKENPEDSHEQMLLAREYVVKGDYNQAAIEYLKCLDMPDIYTDIKRLVLLETYGRLGDMYEMLNQPEEAVKWYNKFIFTDPTYREPYFCLAEIYNNLGQYELSEQMVLIAYKKCIRKYDWVERNDSWIAKGDDLLSVAEFYLGKLDKAIDHCQNALRHSPNDLRILKNYNHMLETKLWPDRQN